MVGPAGHDPASPRLKAQRSAHLSYRPKNGTGPETRTLLCLCVGQEPSPDGKSGMVVVLRFELSQYPDLGIIAFIRRAMHHTSHDRKMAPGVGFEPTDDLINSQALYRLSYPGILVGPCRLERHSLD